MASYVDFHLTGKLNTADDPITLGKEDFQVLTNLRPTDSTPKGVTGMTKINTSGTSYPDIRTGYHFKKDQPSESHILVQTISPTGTSSEIIKSDNTTAIPAQDTFSTFLSLAGTTTDCFFSKAPDGCVAICNSSNNYIWGGNESRCYGFIVFDTDNNDTLYDYTEVVNNTLTDSLNVATMKTSGGGVDGYTIAYYAFENDYTDSSSIVGTSHDLTAVGTTFTNASDALLMGDYSLLANNAYATCSVTADTHFDFSGGTWTVSTIARQTDFTGNRGLWCLYKDASNYVELYSDANKALHLSVLEAGAEKLGWASSNNTLVDDTKATIEIGRDSDDWYMLVNGSLVGTTTDTVNLLSEYATLRVALGVTGGVYYGSIDELKIDVGACRHTTDYTPMTSEFSTSAICNVYIASTRPLQGCKLYVSTANASAATVTGTYWNGAWTALSSVVDGTSSGGVSLAQTGSITWDDTTSDAKVKIFNNQQCYWYRLAFSGIDATTKVYYCTLNATVQAIKDIWDGSPRTALSFMTYSTKYSDYTLNIYQNEYDSTNTGSYVNIADMTSTQYLIVGFFERTMGIHFYFAESNVNTTADTVCTIYYWNGTTWTTVGTLDDGTSESGISFSKSGIISWDAPASSSEYTWTPNNGVPMYYYKIMFNKTVDNTDSKVYLDYITGIPAQTKINHYKFPLFWRNMLLLCGDQSGRKNIVRHSVPDYNCVFNGSGSGEFPIDGDDELMAGGTLFTRFGGDIYDSAILCKKGQTFILGINDDGTIKVDTVSTNKGCIAPYTMKLCDIGFDIATNIKKHILVWLSDSGLMVFDGVSIGTISDYFKNIFDPLDTNYLNRTYAHRSTGEYDPVNHEYVLVWPSGAKPTWKEIRYTLKQQSPFYVDRGTDKALKCVFPVEDNNGTKYMYAGTSGYIERLDYGTTMDGNAINYKFRTADNCLGKSVMETSKVTGIQIAGKAKNTSRVAINMTHYVDGISTGTSYEDILQTDSTHRVFRKFFSTDGKNDGVWHSTEFSVGTTDEDIGFEPTMISYEFESTGNVRSKGG